MVFWLRSLVCCFEFRKWGASILFLFVKIGLATGMLCGSIWLVGFFSLLWKWHWDVTRCSKNLSIPLAFMAMLTISGLPTCENSVSFQLFMSFSYLFSFFTILPSSLGLFHWLPRLYSRVRAEKGRRMKSEVSQHPPLCSVSHRSASRALQHCLHRAFCWEFSGIWFDHTFEQRQSLKWHMAQAHGSVKYTHVNDQISPANDSARTSRAAEDTPSTSMSSRVALSSVAGSGQMGLFLINYTWPMINSLNENKIKHPFIWSY